MTLGKRRRQPKRTKHDGALCRMCGQRVPIDLANGKGGVKVHTYPDKPVRCPGSGLPPKTKGHR